jgi:hypothetical protein
MKQRTKSEYVMYCPRYAFLFVLVSFVYDLRLKSNFYCGLSQKSLKVTSLWKTCAAVR